MLEFCSKEDVPLPGVSHPVSRTPLWRSFQNLWSGYERHGPGQARAPEGLSGRKKHFSRLQVGLGVAKFKIKLRLYFSCIIHCELSVVCTEEDNAGQPVRHERAVSCHYFSRHGSLEFTSTRITAIICECMALKLFIHHALRGYT